MRAPKRKRSIPSKIAKTKLSSHQLSQVLQKISYTGSPEHKKHPNAITNRAKPRADATLCPDSVTEKGKGEIEEWLKEAFRKGAYGEFWEGGFPRYVWYLNLEMNVVFTGRLVNKGTGEYKGYPIEEFEWPKGIRELYE